MHRTTILLPEDLRRAAEREAGRAGISLSELIRRRLADTVEGPPEKRGFFAREPWDGPVPSDVAERHDDYLYGGE